MVYVLGYDTEFDLTAVHDTRKIVELFVVHCVELTVVVTGEICVVMICRRTWTASHVAGRLLCGDRAMATVSCKEKLRKKKKWEGGVARCLVY
jgi:hypothetical protein